MDVAIPRRPRAVNDRLVTECSEFVWYIVYTHDTRINY